ncbi:uncharacterized protein LOC111870803 isoform X2 [Cryptotermes secundus]|uniref:uncharacterized protein LOC111870803 isoform X2 n=1 Tax=Cryptotermes secundus TaxID=105785 RepID=UPI001454DA52|nr:uncharacterized protein LOC111870803 isoform X2 [Cryptotermes secundus]
MTVNIVALSLQRKKACLSISYSSCEGHDAYEIICICATKREGHLMIISGIVMSQLISELIQNDGHVEIFTILGVGMDKFGTYEDTKGRSASKDFIIICCFFILAQIIANILLIWGTIVKNRLYAFPWLLCETASLLMQMVVFVYYAKHKKNEMDRWFTTAALVNIVVTTYLWYIVFRAQEEWSREREDEEDIPRGVEDQID